MKSGIRDDEFGGCHQSLEFLYADMFRTFAQKDILQWLVKHKLLRNPDLCHCGRKLKFSVHNSRVELNSMYGSAAYATK